MTKERVQKVLTIWKTTSHNQEISILELAKLLVNISLPQLSRTSSSTAVLLFTITTSLCPEKEHAIQQENKSGQNVSNRVQLVNRELMSFQWKTFDSIKNPSKIWTDASLKWWRPIVWVWRQEESGLNSLELLAVKNAIPTFTKNK